MFTLIVFPEFHIIDTTSLQEHRAQISHLPPNEREELSLALWRGQMNGKRGSSLALMNLAVDGTALLIVTFLLATTYRHTSKEYRLNKS